MISKHLSFPYITFFLYFHVLFADPVWVS